MGACCSSLQVINILLFFLTRTTCTHSPKPKSIVNTAQKLYIRHSLRVHVGFMHMNPAENTSSKLSHIQNQHNNRRALYISNRHGDPKEPKGPRTQRSMGNPKVHEEPKAPKGPRTQKEHGEPKGPEGQRQVGT